MPKFKLDDKEYDVEVLSAKAQQLTADLQNITARIQETNNMIAILTKAKRAYIADLKSEMLSAKAGFDFGND
jgi:prefoldin subunit 5